jgi:hypothetical protein
MVMENKLHRTIRKYRNLLKVKAEKRKGERYYTLLLKGNKSKNKVLDFYLENNRWPNCRNGSVYERKLGRRFENYVSKEAASYDPHFRRIAMASGRTTNNKRKHDIEGFKKEILTFIETHGRSPMRYQDQTVEGEGNLRSKLDRYTLTLGDMTFLGKVYSSDPCHRSGIPAKYRPIINKALDVEKPLIRLV